MGSSFFNLKLLTASCKTPVVPGFFTTVLCHRHQETSKKPAEILIDNVITNTYYLHYILHGIYQGAFRAYRYTPDLVIGSIFSIAVQPASLSGRQPGSLYLVKTVSGWND